MDYKHADVVTRELDLRTERRRLSTQWKVLFTCYIFIMLTGTALLFLAVTSDAFKNLPASDENNNTNNNNNNGEGSSIGLLRRWGGFDERPLDNKCYRQERTAMLLSLFVGSLGIDQFYAHHWPLAVFKLLAGLSLWLGVAVSVVSDNPTGAVLGGLVRSWSGLWWFIDIVLWIVGGVYGTPGCPGGSKDGWRY